MRRLQSDLTCPGLPVPRLPAWPLPSRHLPPVVQGSQGGASPSRRVARAPASPLLPPRHPHEPASPGAAEGGPGWAGLAVPGRGWQRFWREKRASPPAHPTEGCEEVEESQSRQLPSGPAAAGKTRVARTHAWAIMLPFEARPGAPQTFPARLPSQHPVPHWSYEGILLLSVEVPFLTVMASKNERRAWLGQTEEPLSLASCVGPQEATPASQEGRSPPFPSLWLTVEGKKKKSPPVANPRFWGAHKQGMPARAPAITCPASAAVMQGYTASVHGCTIHD